MVAESWLKRFVCVLALVVAAAGWNPSAALAFDGEKSVLSDEDELFAIGEDDLFSFNEDALFSLSPDDVFSADEDALFGGGGLLVEAEPTTDASLEEVFLVRDRLDVGGTYRAGVDTGWIWLPGTDSSLRREPQLTAGGTLFVDARPSRDFRFFAKARGDGVLTEESADAHVRLHELFFDFVAGDSAFFRVGKQAVKWGVGYFFSPADVINVGRIDPEKPEEEREGPVAVRLNVPAGRNNWYGYAVIDGNADDGFQVALAPKVEFVVGGTEMGLGLYYRADRAPRAMATVSTTLGRFAVFGELVVSKGSDKKFVQLTTPTSLNPLGLDVYTDKETLFTHATAGARYTHSDPDGRYTLTAVGQYYFNGEGYGRQILAEHGWKLPLMVMAGELREGDVEYVGRHYGALLVSGSHESLRDVNASVLWLGSFSDGTGMVTVSLGYGGWKYVKPTVSVSRTYGDIGGPMDMSSSVTTATVGLTVSGSF